MTEQEPPISLQDHIQKEFSVFSLEAMGQQVWKYESEMPTDMIEQEPPISLQDHIQKSFSVFSLGEQEHEA